MDLSLITAPRRTIPIQGQDWTFTALTNGDNEELLLLMKDNRPDPKTIAAEMLEKLPTLTVEERRRILELTFHSLMRPAPITTVEFELWKEGPEGVIEVWWRKLRTVHSAINRDHVRMLYEASAAEDIQKVDKLDEIPLGNSSGPAETTGPDPK